MTITPLVRRVHELHRDPGGELRWCLGCDLEPIGVVSPVSGNEWIWWARPHAHTLAKMGNAFSEDEAMRAVEQIALARMLHDARKAMEA